MLKKKDRYIVAVVGATGAVGNEMVSILEERKFPVGELRLFASERTAGEKMSFFGKDHVVNLLDQNSLAGVDIALFSAGEEISKRLAPEAVSTGVVVIDNSAAWRMDPVVPLVVPEVNSHAIMRHQGIIANPNCSTIQLVVVLKPIHDAGRIKRVVVSSYQSVSGTGKEAIKELMDQTRALLTFRELKTQVYPFQIAFNVLPQIGSFDESGSSTEENKLVSETCKIMEDSSIGVTATAVRVPVFRAHSESVNVETRENLPLNKVRAVLSKAAGVLVYDDPSKKVYPMPVDVVGTDAVFVGRIREDDSRENAFNLWVVADNLRKGSALNAIQIAEELVKDSSGSP